MAHQFRADRLLPPERVEFLREVSTVDYVVWRTASHDADLAYYTAYDGRHHTWRCTCLAGQHRRTCSHVDSCRYWLAYNSHRTAFAALSARELAHLDAFLTPITDATTPTGAALLAALGDAIAATLPL